MNNILISFIGVLSYFVDVMKYNIDLDKYYFSLVIEMINVISKLNFIIVFI